MAIADAYSTAAAYRAVTGRTDTSADADILTDLTAISRYIEGKLMRFFNKDAADVIRVYVPAQNSRAIWIDDLSAAPATVKLDSAGDNTFATTLAATDYELLPLNADKGPEPRPYTRIRMTDWGDYSYFTKSERVQITGKWGWPAVPTAIARATIHLTAILRLETPRATVRIPELSDAIEASPEAQHIIKQLMDQYYRPRYV